MSDTLTRGGDPREAIELKVPADGVVTLAPAPGGRYLVQIGRNRYVKRFNLSATEATQLAALIARHVPGAAVAAP